ncbi:PhoH family protein [Galactobacter caseinivorans]|uniref:PhoH family protein n=1 Tax=Galactobacter caseinivorans TaxID=2676123 RepID=A0A496PJC9_9MICC|nr:PhoH family protein [Galactobacter caseinivorans]RKW70612.1 PhoH family protein [Galactobacter caseinivorans]
MTTTLQPAATTSGTPTGVRTYVVDTSVLISDPRALHRFAEHLVVLPAVVISELEAKRHDLEVGPFARRALRLLDDLRAANGGLDKPLPVGDGGLLRVELNHVSTAGLPAGFRAGGEADQRILAVALNLSTEGADVVLVSKDLPLRLKASALGLGAEEYLHEQVTDTGWTGTAELELAPAAVEQLYAGDAVYTPEVDELPVNTGVVIHAGTSSALARVHADGGLRLVRGDREVFGVRGRSAEQRLAIDLLSDPGVGIVSLGGRAGTGKSALALCAGLEAVLERGEHKKIIVFRPLYAVGGQDLGFLPGSEAEKMGPWGQAVRDTLEALVSPAVLEEVVERGLLEVLPLTHIRGRSLHDAFVIVDEAQSLEKNVLLTVMTRIGQNARVVLTHDVAQRDNLHVGRGDGIAAIVETLKGHRLFGHVTLTRSERSEVAALVADLLDGAMR